MNRRSLNGMVLSTRRRMAMPAEALMAKAVHCSYIPASELWALCPPETRDVLHPETAYPRGPAMKTLVLAPVLLKHIVSNELFVKLEIGRMIVVLEKLPKMLYVDISA